MLYMLLKEKVLLQVLQKSRENVSFDPDDIILPRTALSLSDQHNFSDTGRDPNPKAGIKVWRNL